MATLRIDETTGVQNDGTSEGENNELPYTSTALPTEFQSVLTAVATGTPQIALSDYSTSNTGGSNAYTFGSNVIDVGFTLVNGAGTDSTLLTSDGRKIFLYVHPTDNNVLLGRKGGAGTDPNDPADDVADSTGQVVFAAYLDTGTAAAGDAGATGAKVWLALFQPLKHPDVNDPDDVLTMNGVADIAVSQLTNFSLEGAPSGQFLFLTYGTAGDGIANNGIGDDNVAIVAVGKEPANESAGEKLVDFDTVNSSKGGGDTTLGNTNQMVDPAEGMYFTFVKDANPDFTVAPTGTPDASRLEGDEADEEANIQFNGLYLATSAEFQLVQLQNEASATVKLTAMNTAPEPGVAFVDGLGDGDDEIVTISSVTITTFTKSGNTYTANTPLVFNRPAGADPAPITLGSRTVDFNPDGSATIIGAEVKDKILYSTGPSTHSRVLIDNAGVDPNDAAFDIGGFRITNATQTPFDFDLLQFDDDGPSATATQLTGTVDEDGLSGGIAGGTGDVAGQATTASGNVSTLFDPGADQPGSYSLSTTTSGLPALSSGGTALVYAVSGNVLTATAGAGGPTVFTFSLNHGGTSGAYLFTLSRPLDHASGNDENDITIDLSSILRGSDREGDSVAAAANALVITVDDDSPVVQAVSTTLAYANGSNPTPGGTGVFDFAIGADARSTFSSSSSDLAVSFASPAGSVGSNAISNASVTWASESVSQAVFNVAFTYVSDPINNTSTNATGTLTFNKDAGSYTLALAQPIASFSVLSTSGAGDEDFVGYAPGTSTIDNTQAEVSVAALASDFFVQFTGRQESGGGTDTASKNNNLDAVAPNLAFDPSSQPAGDDAWVTGEVFRQSSTHVTVGNDTAGVAGDTMQSGEVLDFNFYAADPSGFLGTTPTATSSAIFIEFDGLDNNEDLVVVLKLVDAGNPATRTTKAVVVDYADIFHKAEAASIPAAFGFTGTLDNNDGLVVIEQQDYNFSGQNWVIEGAQVLASTEGVSGTAINLNGAIGTGGATLSSSTQTFADATDTANVLPNGNEAGTWDGDVFKIVNIGFVTNVPQDAQLNFNVSVKDNDGDQSPTQSLSVAIDGDGDLVPTSGADTMVIGGSTDADGLLGITMYNVTSGFASGTDKLDLAIAGGANYAENLVAAADLEAFVTAANAALGGATTQHYFGVVGGNGYLASDSDHNGITTIVQLAGVTDLAAADII